MPRTESEAPVFLIGAARSGTSLLYKVLCLHPDAAYISNWVRLRPGLPQLARLNRVAAHLPERRRRVWFGRDSNAYVYGRRRALGDRLFPMPVEGEPVFRHCGIPEDPTGRPPAGESERACLRRAFSRIRRHSGGRVMLSKRIANNLRIPLLHAAFPAARFVVITRDGRAVAYSLSRVDWWETSHVWWYGGSPQRWRDEGRDPWEICARNWVEELREIEAGITGVPDEQVLRLSYEEFVRDPIPTLERVAAFAGLRPDEDWMRALRELSFPDRNESWRGRLDADTAARIEGIQAEELRRHGYAA